MHTNAKSNANSNVGNEKTHATLMKEGTNGVANSNGGNGKTDICSMKEDTKEGTEGGSCHKVEVSTIMDVGLTSISGEKTSSPVVKEPAVQVPTVVDVEGTSKSGEIVDTAGGLLSRTPMAKSTTDLKVYIRRGLAMCDFSFLIWMIMKI